MCLVNSNARGALLLFGVEARVSYRAPFCDDFRLSGVTGMAMKKAEMQEHCSAIVLHAVLHRPTGIALGQCHLPATPGQASGATRFYHSVSHFDIRHSTFNVRHSCPQASGTRHGGQALAQVAPVTRRGERGRQPDAGPGSCQRKQSTYRTSVTPERKT